MKQDNGKRNENSRPIMNIMRNEFVSNQGEIRILFQYNIFRTKLSFYGRKLEIIMKLLKLFRKY